MPVSQQCIWAFTVGEEWFTSCLLAVLSRCPGVHPRTLTRDSNPQFSSGFSFLAGGNAPTASFPFRQEHGLDSGDLG